MVFRQARVRRPLLPANPPAAPDPDSAPDQQKPSPPQTEQREVLMPKQPPQRSKIWRPCRSVRVTTWPLPRQIGQGTRPDPWQRWQRRLTGALWPLSVPVDFIPASVLLARRASAPFAMAEDHRPAVLSPAPFAEKRAPEGALSIPIPAGQQE